MEVHEDVGLRSVAEALTNDTLPQDPQEAQLAIELSLRRAQAPAQVPGYRIQHCLGEGAYGSVWLAYELNTGKYVAIKFYTHRRGLDWSLLNREVEKLAVLYTCRNIVGLLDVGWDSDPPYYVMEYLENGSLGNLLQHGPLPVQEAERIVRIVLQALVHAHGSGILHCDLKPANVLLDGDFEPRLADFGQSRLSDEQHPALGTLFYMAPEQADLDAVPDARWDVYALGAVLYQTLTGEVPHRTPESEKAILSAETLEERLRNYRRLLKHGPRPSAHRRVREVDKLLADIIDRCLEYDPAKRFPNAQAVLEALDDRSKLLARRPLVTLGVVFSALLLLAMVPLARKFISVAVNSASASLIDRALESDAVTARILARSIERDLEDRTSELLDVAADPELPAAIAAAIDQPWQERYPLRTILDRWKSKIDEYRLTNDRERDESWLLTDHRGIQLYRDPYDPATTDKNYAWRSYYNGQAQDAPKGTIQPPLQHPYVSVPFPSEATHQFMVAVSVPVRHEGEVIAVLSRTIHLGQLLTPYKPQIGSRTNGAVSEGTSNGSQQIERFVALVGGNYELLDHPWIQNEEHRKNLPPEVYQKMRLGERQRQKLAHLRKLVCQTGGDELDPALIAYDRDDRYVDPFGILDRQYSDDWLAAFWPVGDTGWIAVVQERKPVALLPVDEMQAGLIKYAWLGLLFCGALIGALWYFIFRALNSRSRAAFVRPAGMTPVKTGTSSLSDT